MDVHRLIHASIHKKQRLREKKVNRKRAQKAYLCEIVARYDPIPPAEHRDVLSDSYILPAQIVRADHFAVLGSWHPLPIEYSALKR